MFPGHVEASRGFACTPGLVQQPVRLPGKALCGALPSPGGPATVDVRAGFCSIKQPGLYAKLQAPQLSCSDVKQGAIRS